jgi:hypothetical protein
MARELVGKLACVEQLSVQQAPHPLGATTLARKRSACVCLLVVVRADCRQDAIGLNCLGAEDVSKDSTVDPHALGLLDQEIAEHSVARDVAAQHRRKGNAASRGEPRLRDNWYGDGQGSIAPAPPGLDRVIDGRLGCLP